MTWVLSWLGQGAENALRMAACAYIPAVAANRSFVMRPSRSRPQRHRTSLGLGAFAFLRRPACLHGFGELFPSGRGDTTGLLCVRLLSPGESL